MIKILIIRLSSLGDIIHTFPMINDIKNNIKQIEIDWLVDKNFEELIMINKNINNIYSIELRKSGKNIIKIIKEIIKLNKTVKLNRYDYIIDSQGLLKSAILTKFINGKSYGFSFYSIKEKLASIFYNNKIYVNKNQNATLRYRELAKKIFNYELNILNNVNFGLVNNDIRKNNLNNTIIFFHATSDNSKKYPFNETINLLNKIVEHYNYNILLPYGNNIEYNESLKIKDNLNNKKLILIPDKIYSYKELYNIIKNAIFIIGVDTGLIHLSNAMNKKIIALFNKTDPNKTGIIENENAINLGGINITISSDEVFKIFVQLINNK